MNIELSQKHFMGIPHGGITANMSGREAAFMAGASVLFGGLATVGAEGIALAMSLLSDADFAPARASQTLPPIPLAYWLLSVKQFDNYIHGFLVEKEITGDWQENKIRIGTDKITQIRVLLGTNRRGTKSKYGPIIDICTVDGSEFKCVKNPSPISIISIAGLLRLEYCQSDLIKAVPVSNLHAIKQRLEQSLEYEMSALTNILGEKFLREYFNVIPRK